MVPLTGVRGPSRPAPPAVRRPVGPILWAALRPGGGGSSKSLLPALSLVLGGPFSPTPRLLHTGRPVWTMTTSIVLTTRLPLALIPLQRPRPRLMTPTRGWIKTISTSLLPPRSRAHRRRARPGQSHPDLLSLTAPLVAEAGCASLTTSRCRSPVTWLLSKGAWHRQGRKLGALTAGSFLTMCRRHSAGPLGR